MSERGKRLKMRLELLTKQLEVYRRYPEEYEKALGMKGIQQWLDDVLDEMIYINRELKKLGE
jgi:hypothetical protein